MRRWLVLAVVVAACRNDFDLAAISETDQALARSVIEEYEDMGCSFDSLLPGTISISFQDLHRRKQGEFVHSLTGGGELHLDSSDVWYHGAGDCYDALDVRSAILHELGHAVGLGHTTREGSVMFPGLLGCEVRDFDAGERQLVSFLCHRI